MFKALFGAKSAAPAVLPELTSSCRNGRGQLGSSCAHERVNFARHDRRVVAAIEAKPHRMFELGRRDAHGIEDVLDAFAEGRHRPFATWVPPPFTEHLVAQPPPHHHPSSRPAGGRPLR
jgi:hypothetical protein